MTSSGGPDASGRSGRIPVRGILLRATGGAGGAVPSIDELCEAARLAERVGVDGIWVDDVLADPGRGEGGEGFEAFSLLGALSQVTTTSALGVLRSPADRRPPGVLAKIVTTLDALCGGRAVVALAAPSLATDDPGGVVVESIQAFRLVATGEPATFAGRHVRLEGAVSRPPAHHPDGIPLLVHAAPETLEAVARPGVADGLVVDVAGGDGALEPRPGPVTLAVVGVGADGTGTLAASAARARAGGFTGVVVPVDVAGPGGGSRVEEAARAVTG
jgi:alkanesulfonate monooxygenase SsuD/methylene tetrahydromethanopterin reductase-like flavin-dependent oxidoreductase (luciferase family)